MRKVEMMNQQVRWGVRVCVCACVCVCVCVCVFSSSVMSLCKLMDYSPAGSSVCENFQARYWSRLPFPSPWDLPDPGIEPMSLGSPTLAGRFFTSRSPRKPQGVYGKEQLKFIQVFLNV